MKILKQEDLLLHGFIDLFGLETNLTKQEIMLNTDLREKLKNHLLTLESDKDIKETVKQSFGQTITNILNDIDIEDKKEIESYKRCKNLT